MKMLEKELWLGYHLDTNSKFYDQTKLLISLK